MEVGGPLLHDLNTAAVFRRARCIYKGLVFPEVPAVLLGELTPGALHVEEVHYTHHCDP